MKPRDKGGVVDPRLNVYGVVGLKVAGMVESILSFRKVRRTLFQIAASCHRTSVPTRTILRSRLERKLL